MISTNLSKNIVSKETTKYQKVLFVIKYYNNFIEIKVLFCSIGYHSQILYPQLWVRRAHKDPIHIMVPLSLRSTAQLVSEVVQHGSLET